MGHGIAHAAVVSGFQTRLYDVSDAQLDSAAGSIRKILARAVDLEKRSTGDADAAAGRLTTTSSLEDALGGTDFVIEAAPERIDLKLKLMADIERRAPAETVIATNTSALSITEMAGALANPSRVAGMHFFNPVHKMKLIEIVRALETTTATLDAVEAVARLIVRIRALTEAT
jgi:3-hydroxybutyryl-CoA dehydrogenase